LIAKFYFKALVSNKSLWGWGVGFMVFWLFMGSYVFGFNMTSKVESLGYTSVWFSLIGLISGSIIATSVAYSVYYANSSLAYGFRFTKLKPSSYIFNLMGSTSVVAGIMGAIIIMFTIVLFSSRSGYILIPAYPELSILVFLVEGLFMFLLSVVLVISANNYTGLKSISFVVYIPQLLAYLFGFSELGIPLPSAVVYASPFSDIPRLLFETYYGKAAPLNMSNGTGPLLNPVILIASLLVWTALLFVLAMFLVRRIRPRSIEEARQI
jgi:hypothetical protein